MPEYVFDNAGKETVGRFGALEEIYDGNSMRQLSPFVTPGKRCLEVGAGSGSIATWMGERVGAEGHVLATDINIRFLDGLAAPNVEVRAHDITTDPLDRDAFDVIHTRLVLVHLPDREAVLRRLVEALRPGGWLVLEEFESLSMKPDPASFPSETLFKTLDAMWANMGSRGADVQFGRKLPPLLEGQGLVDVAADGYVTRFQGGTAGARLMRANFMQTRDALFATGRITEAEFEADLARLEDPDVSWPSSVMWTVRGRKA